MHVLDTNVVSELLKPAPDTTVINCVEECARSGPIAVTSITVAELLAGLERMPERRRSRQLRELVEEFIDKFDETNSILHFDLEAARCYGTIVSNRLNNGRPIDVADAQIASVCASRSATLLTRNMRDFELTGIPLINPWNEPTQ